MLSTGRSACSIVINQNSSIRVHTHRAALRMPIVPFTVGWQFHCYNLALQRKIRSRSIDRFCGAVTARWEVLHGSRDLSQCSHRKRRRWKVPCLASGGVGTADNGDRTPMDRRFLPEHQTVFQRRMRYGAQRLRIWFDMPPSLGQSRDRSRPIWTRYANASAIWWKRWLRFT